MSQPTGQSGNSQAADTRTDPAMKALYHMSRTAGVGLGDYAAVNVLSVVGLIVGIACFLLVIFNDSLMMLVLPVAAIITCSAALVQIRGSNKTQVGLPLAVGGIALAVVFGGVNVGMRVKASMDESRSRSDIESLVSKLGSSATTQSSVPAGYDLFHPRFKERVNPDTFARTVAMRTGLSANAPVASIKLGKNVLFETNPDTKVTQATALIVLSAKQKGPDGNPLTLDIPAMFRRDAGGTWTIYAIPEWFSEEPPGKQLG